MQTTKAAMIVIGNEILSGRTQDKNINFLADSLNKQGITLSEVRIIPDDEQMIIDTVKDYSEKYDYVFTTGGIGPTHDDITSLSIAKAFDKKYILNKDAEEILLNYYGKDNLNEARLKMAHMPEGATLLHNPVSAAPGFIIDNIYVMAGVPSIMRAMFDSIKGVLKGGKIVLSKTISSFITEGTLAKELTSIQNNFPDVEIGSYPFIENSRLGTSVVCRSSDESRLNLCSSEVENYLRTLTSELKVT
ncbi:MAG: competence/damage-inducible protein A [Rickettsiales bacterium]